MVVSVRPLSDSNRFCSSDSHIARAVAMVIRVCVDVAG